MKWEGRLKDKAKDLRSRGYTYFEICKSLEKKVPKSTLSYWCREVKLPSFYKRKLAKINADNREKGRQVALTVNRLKRKKFLEGLKNKNLPLIKELNQRDRKLLLTSLYLAEGAKYPVTQYLKFASIDPGMIRFFLLLLRKSFNIDESKFRIEILCRADQDLNTLVNYWQKVTNIKRRLIYKPRIDKRTIGKRTKKKDYKGVCVIDYFDTSIQLELQLLGESLIRGYSSAG
ncbi:hypothetical protein KKI19_01890 [Patescibacteria group bacterium]|nr:hypothetical protein [Patescibacteria group bacterium]